MQKSGRILAGIEMRRMLKSGKKVIVFDISNAFNTIPFEAIIFAMKKYRIHDNVQKYVMGMLEARFCEHI